MGLEARGNRVYYYKKRRIGNRVVSEYYGAGALAQVIAELDENDRFEVEMKKEQSQAELEALKAEIEPVEEMIDDAILAAKPLVDALFLINGYHKHQRTWRRTNAAKSERE